MKICFVSREYPPETARGGIGTFTRTMAHALAGLGHFIQVVSLAPNGEEYTHADGPVSVHRISNRRTPLRQFAAPFGDRAVPLVSSLEHSWAVARKLRALVRDHGIELVEFPEWGAEGLVSLIEPKQRIPMVVRLHTSTQILARLNGDIPKHGPSFWLSARFENVCVRRASAVFSPSRALAALSARDMGLDTRTIHLVPNPIDLDVFFPAKHSQSEESDDPVILYTGRLERRKGVHLFADIIPAILKKFPEAKFGFIGPDTDTAPSGGSMREYLLRILPVDLRSRIIFHGNLPREDLAEHYRRSRVCVFPSMFENFPNTCLEAMACGRPVIGSRSGGMAEMIEHGVSGLLISPDDPGTIVASILGVLENPSWGRELGAAARARVETTYAPRIVAAQITQCFRNVIEGVPCLDHWT